MFKQVKTHALGLDHALEEQGLHVIDIHPRAHHLAPGGVALDVGDFGHRLVVPRLGPEVFDKALPVFLHRIDKGDKQVLARGVGVMLPPYSRPRPSRNKAPGPSPVPGALVRPAAS